MPDSFDAADDVTDPEAVRLRYEHGTIRIEAGSDRLETILSREATPYLPRVEFDPRTETGRAPGFAYAEIRASLAGLDGSVEDEVLQLDSDLELETAYELREYQREALDAWLETDRWESSTIHASRGRPIPTAASAGVLELPTGSGKTVIGLKAIEHLSTPTLVVVPTIDLLEQWIDELEREFSVPVGRFGGGEQRLEALTVSTYDSAYLKAEAVGDRFGLVVFDETHHLGGEGYRDIARLLAAPARLGLTATFERADGAHERVEELVGPLVHRVAVDDLAGDHLASYDLKRIEVSLTPEERDVYEENQDVFTSYLARSNIQLRSGSDYRRLVMRSGSDPAAREALLARKRAREIMLASEGKLDALEDILDDHRGERTIVFTASNDLAYDVAERFLIPAITHQTGTSERREILERFRDGAYTRVVTSNVLDEGIDVPDASLAVVLSGSGSEREFTQRLGRILRPKDDGRRAILYEVISEETGEERVSQRRR